MVISSRQRMTEDEFLAKLTDEKPSWEFVNGEVCQKRAMTKRKHLLIADELAAVLRAYRLQAGGLSGPDPTTNLSRGSDRRYRVPDLAYWAPGRPTGEDVFLPPTLAVEILSPGQSLESQRQKCREYRVHGVDACWLIDPETRRVEVFEAGRDGDSLPADGALTSAHLPGFVLSLKDLFAALG